MSVVLYSSAGVAQTVRATPRQEGGPGTSTDTVASGGALESVHLPLPVAQSGRGRCFLCNGSLLGGYCPNIACALFMPAPAVVL